MTYLKVIVFDDDAQFTKKFSELLTEDGFTVLEVNNIDDLVKLLDDPKIMDETAALIFDLAQSNQEEQTAKNFSITERIQKNFDQWRIPIFIHSGFAGTYEHFKDCGTVWKKEKTGTSIEEVCNLIKTLSEAGFNDTFGVGGALESTILSDLHSAFVGQFRTGEIEKIITSYTSDNKEESKERLIGIFKRIAIKSFMSGLMSPAVIINPTEIYYRRTNDLKFWTGDIFEKNDKSEMVMILTPRCDVASKGVDSLLICTIEPEFPTSKKEAIKSALTNNPNLSGNSFRYLPPSPLFTGGRVNLSKHRTISKADITENFTRLMSLSDEITNEILGKFSSYFLRTGINPINLDEVLAYFESMKEPDANKK